MNIRTEKDLELLDKKIQEELGVDVQKYRNEEVAENFVELLVFPEYVISWVIRPVLVSLAIFILGFYILNLVHLEYIIYAVIGLGLFLTTGLLIGLLSLCWKMKSDMWGIVDYSLDVMKLAVSDMNKVNNQVTKENRKDVLGLLFKGIIHIVTIPMLSQAISDKVPLIGNLVNGIAKKILTTISNAVKFDEENLKQELSKKENEPNALEIYSNAISIVSEGLEKLMNFTFKVAEWPLMIGLFIAIILLILFLYLIN